MRDLSKYTQPFEFEHITIEGPIKIEDISVVIPAFNNQNSLDRLIHSFLNMEGEVPLEIIVVDNNSTPSLKISTSSKPKIPIHLFYCKKKGAAAARNVGISKAKGKWIHFCDDDCIATPDTLKGYIIDQNGSIAYNGKIVALGADILSNFYQAQGTLTPPPCKYGNMENIPMYIVTANALVNREILQKVNGFDEDFHIAAEDIDISIRLFKHGLISYAPHSIVEHDFSGGIYRFIKRFIRYGIANKHLERKWKIKRKPNYHKPVVKTKVHKMLRYLEYYSLLIGYKMTKL
ncbi:MAG: glycosyltransferase family 2 protein [Bacteroidales bacterium]|jgi:glycosyltransferase involved in cell wall biosynthesis|nr:glycosyltransferase family 2 protein [Bacteroidales bacterium]